MCFCARPATSDLLTILQLCEVFRHIALPYDLDAAAPIPFDALKGVQSAKYRVTLASKTADNARETRNAIDQQMAIRPLLKGLRCLDLEIDLEEDLDVDDAQCEPSVMGEIVANFYTGKEIIHAHVSFRACYVMPQAIIAYISSILKPLASVPNLSLSLEADSEYEGIEALGLVDMRQAFLCVAANLRSLSLSSLEWITWLPSDAAMPNLQDLAVDVGSPVQGFTVSGPMLERLVAFVNCAGGKLSSLSVAMICVVDGLAATSLIRCDQLQQLTLGQGAWPLLARSTALVPIKHLELDFYNLPRDLQSLRDLLDEATYLPGLETLHITNSFFLEFSWSEIAVVYRQLRQAALRRNVDISLELNFLRRSHVVELVGLDAILECLRDIAGQVALNLEMPHIDFDTFTAYPDPAIISLVKARAITIDLPRIRLADVSAINAFEALMRHISVPEVTDLRTSVASWSADVLRIVGKALESCYWPRLRTITGRYTLEYYGATAKGWSHQIASATREAFRKECAKRDINIEGLKFKCNYREADTLEDFEAGDSSSEDDVDGPEI